MAKEKKDLGVIIQNNLSPEKHIAEIFGETIRMLKNILVTFHFLNKEIMKKN